MNTSNTFQKSIKGLNFIQIILNHLKLKSLYLYHCIISNISKKIIIVFLFCNFCFCIDNIYANIDAWPLLEINDESTTILYPLFVKEKNFTMIFPFYFNTNQGKDHHFFWPLVKISEDRLKRALPFWLSEDNDFTLFPLLRQTPKYTFWSVPPMYFQNDDNFSAIIPFYIKNKNKLFIFPNIYRNKNKKKIKNFIVFPFVDYYNDNFTKSINYLYLTGNKISENHESKWFLPFYYSCIEKNLNSLWILPYYYRNSKYQVITEFFPVYSKTKGINHESLRIFNYYTEKKLNKKSKGIFPFYHYVVSNKGNNEKGYVIELFASLYKKELVLSENGKIIEKKRRFLFFSDELNRNGKRQFKIFDSVISERM